MTHKSNARMHSKTPLLDELLSTSPEVHSFMHGMYSGMTEWKGAELPSNPDVSKEPRYYKGGYILGTFIRWGAILLLGSVAL